MKETHENHWSIDWEINPKKNFDRLSIPSHFKKYTAETRKIILKQPMRDISRG